MKSQNDKQYNWHSVGADDHAIIHIDADAFFASCEQALHPEYRGKPVITGLERGIVSAASYEAKRLGIQRGVPLQDVKKICPTAIIVPSDYESYSLFSKRLFEIVRRFTSEVEEYGMEEAFADITGLRRPLHKSYPAIAAAIKTTIEQELGITVSVGLSSSKVLAKVASKWNKPSGCVYISPHDRSAYLQKLPIERVWGIGHNTARYLEKFGIRSAGQFAQRSLAWIEQHVTKPHQEIWHELNGQSVLPIHTEEKKSYQSIGKTKTFTPASSDYNYVLAQLSKNVENACLKARRHHLGAKQLILYLKTRDFRYAGLRATLNRSTAFPNHLMPIARQLFDRVFRAGTLYRATGIVLQDLQTLDAIQLDLFEPALRVERQQRVYESVDALARKYGKHTVCLGSSLAAHTRPDQRQQLYTPQAQAGQKVHVGLSRKFIGLPLLQVKI